MSSLFRKFGGGSKKSDKAEKSPSKGNVENKSPDGLRKSPVKSLPQANPNNNVLTKEENGTSMSDGDFPELSLPVTRKKERNMSISKSGRHKYKSKQRGSVLQHDMYSPTGTSSSETSPTSPPGGNSRTRGPWDNGTSLGAPLSLSTGQPTSV